MAISHSCEVSLLTRRKFTESNQSGNLRKSILTLLKNSLLVPLSFQLIFQTQKNPHPHLKQKLHEKNAKKVWRHQLVSPVDLGRDFRLEFRHLTLRQCGCQQTSTQLNQLAHHFVYHSKQPIVLILCHIWKQRINQKLTTKRWSMTVTNMSYINIYIYILHLIKTWKDIYILYIFIYIYWLITTQKDNKQYYSFWSKSNFIGRM